MPDSVVRDVDGGQALVVAIRRSSRPPLRRVSVALLAIWLGGVLTITLWPHHVDRAAAPGLRRILAVLHEDGLIEWLTYPRLEVLANVALLMPLGALAVLALGRRRAPVVLLGSIALSTLVEAIQWFMPHRTASLVDIAANGLGAAIGVAIAALLDAVATRRRSRVARASLIAAARRSAATPAPNR